MLPLKGLRQIESRIIHVHLEFFVEQRNAAHLRAQLGAQQHRHEHRGDGAREGRQGLASAPIRKQQNEVMHGHHDEGQPTGGQQQMARLARAPRVHRELRAVHDEDGESSDPNRDENRSEHSVWSEQQQRIGQHDKGQQRLFQARHVLTTKAPGELTKQGRIRDEQHDVQSRHRQAALKRPTAGRKQRGQIANPGKGHDRVPTIRLL